MKTTASTPARPTQAERALARWLRQAWLWSAYWRLYPLWDLLRQAVPEIELPNEPGMRWNIRYRLHRRVIEIRDAQLVLRPYAQTEIARLAAAAAKSSGLPPEGAAAVVEAAEIVSSLQSRLRSPVPSHDAAPRDPVSAAPRNDIRAEAAALILVCRAIRRSPIVRRLAGRPPRRMTLLGRMTERVTRGLDHGLRKPVHVPDAWSRGVTNVPHPGTIRTYPWSASISSALRAVVRATP